MKIKGIPFILNITESENNETAKGIRGSVLADVNIGNYRGALIAGASAGTSDINGEDKIGSDLEGLCLSGFLSGAGNLKGVGISGAVNYIKDELNGFCYGTLFNNAGSNGKIAIQVGVANNITKYNNFGTVIQLGLYNRAGEQTIPLINIRGLKNLKKKR